MAGRLAWILAGGAAIVGGMAIQGSNFIDFQDERHEVRSVERDAARIARRAADRESGRVAVVIGDERREVDREAIQELTEAVGELVEAEAELALASSEERADAEARRDSLRERVDKLRTEIEEQARAAADDQPTREEIREAVRSEVREAVRGN